MYYITLKSTKKIRKLKKTDHELYLDVTEKLKFAPNSDEQKILVEVKNSIVSLSEYVSSFFRKNLS